MNNVSQWRREDKKTKISPWVSKWTAERVHDVARWLRCSDGEAGRLLVAAAVQDIPTLNRLSPYFWRDHYRGDTAWVGHSDHSDLSSILDGAEVRLHVRVSRDEWKEIDEVAFALGRPVAHATAALIIMAIKDERITSKVAPGFQPRSIFSLRGGTVLWGSGRTQSSAFRK